MTQWARGRAPEASGRSAVSLVPLLVLAAFPFVVIRLRLAPVDDPDTYWHIVAGRYLWETGQFVGPDPLSRFTSYQWVLHEWAPELVMALSDRIAGLAAVVWLTAACSVLVFVSLFSVCRQFSALLPATLAAVCGWIGASASMGPRPQLVTLLCLSLTVGAWLRSAVDHKVRWWLVALTWVWAMSHGLWFAGPLTGAAVVAGMAVTDRDLKQQRAQAALVAATLFAGFATPTGWTYLGAASRVAGTNNFVSEWRPADLHRPYVMVVIAMLAVVAVWGARSGRRIPAHQVALWLLALGWTLAYARTVALGAIIVAPLFAMVCNDLARGRLGPREATERLIVVAGPLLALTVAAVLAPQVATASRMVPPEIDRAVAGLPSGSVLVNEYSLGGWLYFSHPDVRPVADPRVELYTVRYLDDYANALSGGPGWQQFVDSSGAEATLLPTSSALTERLARAGWRTVATDPTWTVLRRP